MLDISDLARARSPRMSLQGDGSQIVPALAALDAVRQMQGHLLDLLGFGPTECHYNTLASGTHWRLRKYAQTAGGAPLLIIAAPIKRPYIWDLSPFISAIRRCLQSHFCPYLLEWAAPSADDSSSGLADYAGRFISEVITRVSGDAGGAKPFLIGHSLGGTLAALFAAYECQSIRGLVLLATPLCFAPGSSPFRDAIVSLAPSFAPVANVIPGSFLSQLSAMASPQTFVWSRLLDAGFCINDPRASEVHVRVERWTLDEFPLSGMLMRDILHWLYRENRFCAETLRIADRTVGPSCLRVPTLAVVNAADAIAPRTSISPFIDAIRQATPVSSSTQVRPAWACNTSPS